LIGFGLSNKPETADYTIKGFRKFIVDFLKERIGLEEREHKKISIVGHSLGGYIAAEVAIGNKEMIEKLVLIDSSGMLEGPTPLLQQYLNAAMESDPILRYKKVQRVLEDLYADRSSFQWRSVFLLEQLDNKVQNMHLS
jgi:pimeloyl-ACP methyl ester carboxylesterase